MYRKIRLLHITLWLSPGGLERLIVEMCKKIDLTRFDVQVLCLIEYDLQFKMTLERLGIKVHLIKRRGRFDYSFFLKAMHFIKRGEFDIVHAYSGCFFNSAIFTHFTRGCKTVYTAHGMQLSFDLKSRIEDRIASALIDKLIAVSNEIHVDLMKRFPSQSIKIMLILNGVNTDTFRPRNDLDSINNDKKYYNIPQEKTIIGTVGRLDPIKNYGCLVKAFSILNNYNNSTHLIFVGDGSERFILNDLVKKEGLERDVTFLGIQYDIHKILPLFDVFTLSSLTEGTSISLLEAQSCGIPSVVTDVGGNRKIIKNSYNGFLCKVNDDEDIAKKIHIILNHRQMARKMGENAREMVLNNFSLSSTVRNYEKLYEVLAPSR